LWRKAIDLKIHEKQAMKRDGPWFESCDPCLIFIARRLAHAERLESIFTAAGIDYGVEADHYASGLIFRSVKVGAFFYVRPEARERAEAVMLENGFVPAKSPG
jgi:hypothetical protein